jgi:hypothetical protein
MRGEQPQPGQSARPHAGRPAGRHPRALALAAMVALIATVLTACSSSTTGLIPAVNASPLQSDFEAVAQAAQNGNGSCGETAEDIRKTEQDFAALPVSVANSLRNRLSEGIKNLSNRALQLCTQRLSETSTTTTASRTQSAATTTTTSTTETTTETTTEATATTSSPGGGTAAPGAGETAPGTGAGEQSPNQGGVGTPEAPK